MEAAQVVYLPMENRDVMIYAKAYFTISEARRIAALWEKARAYRVYKMIWGFGSAFIIAEVGFNSGMATAFYVNETEYWLEWNYDGRTIETTKRSPIRPLLDAFGIQPAADTVETAACSTPKVAERKPRQRKPVKEDFSLAA